jgi:hypothetical protein
MRRASQPPPRSSRCRAVEERPNADGGGGLRTLGDHRRHHALVQRERRARREGDAAVARWECLDQCSRVRTGYRLHPRPELPVRGQKRQLIGDGAAGGVGLGDRGCGSPVATREQRIVQRHRGIEVLAHGRRELHVPRLGGDLGDPRAALLLGVVGVGPQPDEEIAVICSAVSATSFRVAPANEPPATTRGRWQPLPPLEPRFRAELAHALTHLPLIAVLRRVTGRRWAPKWTTTKENTNGRTA